ncbi:beta-ketoacyl synthase N-terminal-like domain-containing protein [Streptomyces sp. R28]|uniref:Beta-ketoacyl synthase N-terminal-like domain-containing protein n=1 Tax=Streptomyces sp. R28 TaxID=3238628 RepID=A0AB39PP95_9ACTN
MNRPNSAPFEAAVTGLGIICAAGIGAKAAWQSAVQGTVGHITRPPTLEGLPHDFAYSVPDFDADTVLGRPLARQMDRFSHLAVAATREALADAALDPSEWDATRVAVLIGSSHGGLTIYDTQTTTMHDKGDRRVSPMLTPLTLLNAAASSVCLDTGARGPSMGIAGACASGTAAIGYGRMLLQAGLADIVIAGGAESMQSRALFASCIRARACSPSCFPPRHAHDGARNGTPKWPPSPPAAPARASLSESCSAHQGCRGRCAVRAGTDDDEHARSHRRCAWCCGRLPDRHGARRVAGLDNCSARDKRSSPGRRRSVHTQRDTSPPPGAVDPSMAHPNRIFTESGPAKASRGSTLATTGHQMTVVPTHG